MPVRRGNVSIFVREVLPRKEVSSRSDRVRRSELLKNAGLRIFLFAVEIPSLAKFRSRCEERREKALTAGTAAPLARDSGIRRLCRDFCFVSAVLLLCANDYASYVSSYARNTVSVEQIAGVLSTSVSGSLVLFIYHRIRIDGKRFESKLEAFWKIFQDLKESDGPEFSSVFVRMRRLDLANLILWLILKFLTFLKVKDIVELIGEDAELYSISICLSAIFELALNGIMISMMFEFSYLLKFVCKAFEKMIRGLELMTRESKLRLTSATSRGSCSWASCLNRFNESYEEYSTICDAAVEAKDSYIEMLLAVVVSITFTVAFSGYSVLKSVYSSAVVPSNVYFIPFMWMLVHAFALADSSTSVHSVCAQHKRAKASGRISLMEMRVHGFPRAHAKSLIAKFEGKEIDFTVCNVHLLKESTLISIAIATISAVFISVQYFGPAKSSNDAGIENLTRYDLSE